MLQCFPQSASVIGRTAWEHWCMCTLALTIWPWALAPTFSCREGNIDFSLMQNMESYPHWQHCPHPLNTSRSLRSCIKVGSKSPSFSAKRSTMSKVELQSMQQGGVLEAGRHSPFKCWDQYKIQSRWGEHGVCGRIVALPKPASLCGTPHRLGGAQPYHTQKLPVAHQQQQRK